MVRRAVVRLVEERVRGRSPGEPDRQSQKDEAPRRGPIFLEVGDRVRTAGGDERGQLLSDDPPAERRVVPG